MSLMKNSVHTSGPAYFATQRCIIYTEYNILIWGLVEGNISRKNNFYAWLCYCLFDSEFMILLCDADVKNAWDNDPM